MTLAPRVLRAIFARLAAKAKQGQGFLKSPVGQMIVRASKKTSEHRYVAKPFQKGLAGSTTSASDVGDFLRHIGGRSNKAVSNFLKGVERFAKRGHPEAALPVNALKRVSKIAHDTAVSSAREGLQTVAGSAAGKVAQGSYSVIDALLHNTGRAYSKRVRMSSIKALQKRGLKTGLGKTTLGLTAVTPVLPTKGIDVSNKLRRFVINKYSDKMTKGRKFLAQAIGKEPLKPEISNAVIRAQHREFQGALRALRPIRVGRRGGPPGPLVGGQPVLETHNKAVKVAEKAFNEQITKTKHVVSVDKAKNTVKKLEKELTKTKDTKVIPKIKKQLKKAKDTLGENELLQEKRQVFNAAREAWLKEAEYKAPDAFKTYEAAKTGTINAKRAKLLGGTNVKLGPPLVLAGTAAYAGVKGTQALYKSLKTESERQKLRETGALKLKALKEIYKNNHPNLSESAVDQLAKKTLYAHDLSAAQQDMTRNLLSSYQHIDRLGGIIPKETPKKATKTVTKKSTGNAIKKLKISGLRKLFGGKKKEEVGVFMAKKSKSRLRAIFASLRSKGKLLRQAYSERKTKKLYRNFDKVNKQFEAIRIKTHGGLPGFDKESLARLGKEIQLMKEVGLWKENPTKKEQIERTKQLYAINVLEKHIRQDVETEYQKKTDIKDVINAALGTDLFANAFKTKYRPKYEIEASLKNVSPTIVDKIGAKIQKDSKLTPSQKIDFYRRLADEGKITEGFAQNKMQKILKKVRERKEAKAVLEGGEEPAHRKLKVKEIGGSRGKNRKRTLDAYEEMMRNR